ncbi:hypothetical protein GGR52DRAFT_577280 [Hypoxylon sp. FL1284]|nr:hypothetical protein GGR52DRAFT_577280 [Hypoxylon sp. FL1284]
MDEASRRRVETVGVLLEGYGSLSVSQLLRPLSSDFRHKVLPQSLGMPSRDRASFVKHATGIFGVFDKFKMDPQSIIDGGPGGTMVVHALMQGVLKNGAGDWKNECIMLIQLSPDGTQVVQVTEFVDSAKAIEMSQKHAPDDFGCENRVQERGREETTSNQKPKTLLYGLCLAQVVVVLVVLRLIQTM